MGYMTSTLTQSLQPHAGACFEFPKHKMMDLDTTKTKQHKTFPSFTPQLLPPPQPIILEIIFSSDDVSEGEQGEESDGDSSCDEDDEDSDVDGADLPTHNRNNHEEEEDTEEEDDEEDEDEGNDAEDSEEDGDDSDADSDEEEEDTIDEDIDPEEFESGFHDNDDLLVEFSHNDEDGLVVEFADDEENEEDDEDTPQAPVNPIPFWFSNEEEDQIRMVFKSYGLTLDIEKQRKACIRAPAPFVGKIRRTPLKPLDGAEKKFMTLDKVEVYIHELCPLGTILPLSRIIWLLTTWDSSEGIPTQSLELTKSMKKSMQKRAQPNLNSTLYCAPVFMTKEEYKYSVSAQEVSLMYTSNSTTNVSISRISPFLPEHCRTVSFSMD